MYIKFTCFYKLFTTHVPYKMYGNNYMNDKCSRTTADKLISFTA